MKANVQIIPCDFTELTDGDLVHYMTFLAIYTPGASLEASNWTTSNVIL